MTHNFEVGQELRIVDNVAYGHGFKIGTRVKVLRVPHVDSYCDYVVEGPNPNSGRLIEQYVAEADLEPV